MACFLCTLWIVGIVLFSLGIWSLYNDGSYGLLIAACVVKVLCWSCCQIWRLTEKTDDLYTTLDEEGTSATTQRRVITLRAAANLERPVPGQIFETVVVLDEISDENDPPPSNYEVFLNPLKLEASEVYRQISEPADAQNPTRIQPNAL
jgi:hypothetical protein